MNYSYMCRSISDMELWWIIIRCYIKLLTFYAQWWIHSTKLARKDYIILQQAASLDTEQFSRSVNVRGEIAKMNCISECIKRPERFGERIAKQKMQTSETEFGRKKDSEIQWKRCHVLLCAWPFWQSFVSFFRRKNWYGRGFIVPINTCSTAIKLLRW